MRATPLRHSDPNSARRTGKPDKHDRTFPELLTSCKSRHIAQKRWNCTRTANVQLPYLKRDQRTVSKTSIQQDTKRRLQWSSSALAALWIPSLIMQRYKELSKAVGLWAIHWGLTTGIKIYLNAITSSSHRTIIDQETSAYRFQAPSAPLNNTRTAGENIVRSEEKIRRNISRIKETLIYTKLNVTYLLKNSNRIHHGIIKTSDHFETFWSNIMRKTSTTNWVKFFMKTRSTEREIRWRAFPI